MYQKNIIIIIIIIIINNTVALYQKFFGSINKLG
jgi:hypothetical protein